MVLGYVTILEAMASILETVKTISVFSSSSLQEWPQTTLFTVSFLRRFGRETRKGRRLLKCLSFKNGRKIAKNCVGKGFLGCAGKSLSELTPNKEFVSMLHGNLRCLRQEPYRSKRNDFVAGAKRFPPSPFNSTLARLFVNG